MGRGSRHSKNAGTMGSESMTYAEMKGLGYGTVKERLGKVLAALIKPQPGQSQMHAAMSCAVPHCDTYEALPTKQLVYIQKIRLMIFLAFCVQDAVGNYNDCRLTLQPAVVSVWPNPCILMTLPLCVFLSYGIHMIMRSRLRDPI